MKLLVAAVLVCLFCVSQAQMPCPRECGPDECCTGGGYNRYCRKFGDNEAICEVPNKYNDYRTACPCKAGLICSIIRRCQPA